MDTTQGNSPARGSASGSNDQPGKTDLLGVDHHVAGLTRFIRTCDTPLTVAVQGGWGTGKTTILNMVENRFAEGDPASVVTVDVWQAAFSSGEADIIVELVTHISRHINDTADESPDPEKVRSLWSRIKEDLKLWRPRGSDIGQAAVMATGALAGPLGMFAAKFAEELAKQTSGRIQQGEDAARKAVVDADVDRDEPEPITGRTVRRHFRDLVEARYPNADSAGPARLIVFIDNLDRLKPERAVEIMESLKAILDAPHCVFVVAVDFDVVTEGIEQKYPGMGATKARAFFDKIIQLPFQIPVGSYNIDGLLGDVFPSLAPLVAADSRSATGTNDLATVRDIIANSIGPNPRSIKRLANAYALIGLITGRGAEGGLDLGMLSLIALQVAYPDIHAYLDERELTPMAMLMTDVDGVDDETGGEYIDTAVARWFGDTAEFRRTTLPNGERSAPVVPPQHTQERLARLLEIFRTLFEADGQFDIEGFRATWRHTAATAADRANLDDASDLSLDEITHRLSERERSAADIEKSQRTLRAWSAAFQRHGATLRVEMQPGDRRLRIGMNMPGRGRPRNIAITYVPMGAAPLTIEISGRYLTGDPASHRDAFGALAEKHRWEFEYLQHLDKYQLRGIADADLTPVVDLVETLLSPPAATGTPAT